MNYLLAMACFLGALYACCGIFGWFDVQPIVLEFLLPWIGKVWHPLIVAFVLAALGSGFAKEADRQRAKQDARDIRDGK